MRYHGRRASGSGRHLSASAWDDREPCAADEQRSETAPPRNRPLSRHPVDSAPRHATRAISQSRVKRYLQEVQSGRQDLNLRPPGPQPGALPDCATPRDPSSLTPNPSAADANMCSCQGTEPVQKCYRCGAFKPAGAFAWRRRHIGQRDSFCRPCRKAYKREHYLANRQRYIDQARVQKARLQLERTRYLLDYFVTHPCIDCGETDPVVLEFDHLRDKEFNIASGSQHATGRLSSTRSRSARWSARIATGAAPRAAVERCAASWSANRRRTWKSARPASNRRPRAWKAHALPTELRAREAIVVGPMSTGCTLRLWLLRTSSRS